jgi:hypothetical protein
MKTILTTLVLLSCCWTAAADELDIRWGGKVQSDIRFRIESKATGDFYKVYELPTGVARNENIFNMKLDALYGSFAGVADVDFVWLGYPESLDGIADLSSRGHVDPYYLQVHALYLEAANFIFEGMDLRIGQQQVKWGVGDQFNPTNTINPNDVEDVLLFGEQMANLMVKLDYAIWDMWTVSGVLVPIFQPALLPRSGYLGIAATDRFPMVNEQLRHRIRSEQQLARQLGWPTVVDEAVPVMPDKSFENMQFAFRLSGTLLNQDIAVSYYRGRTDFPQPFLNYTVQGSPFAEPKCNPQDDLDCVNGLLETETSLGYPEIQVVGLNLSGEVDLLGWLSDSIHPIGYRLEFAAIFPKKQTIGMIQEEMDFGIVTQPAGEYDYDGDGNPGGAQPVVVDEIPFFKWVVGLDYSFGRHVYANLMWIHGLVDEFGIGYAVRQGESLSDQSDLLTCQTSGDFDDCNSREILRQRLGDYIVFGLDFKFLDDRLLLRLFSILDLTGIDEATWDRRANRMIKKHSSFYSEKGFSAVIYPELGYNFGNGLEIGMGVLLQLGKEYTKFGDPAAGGSLAWARARFSF